MTTDITIAEVACRIVRISPKTLWTFIEVTGSDGVRGIGEASAVGVETALQSFARDAADRLAGAPADPIAIAGRLLDTRGGLPQRAVASAVEQALWDGQGKRLGVPVTELLGGALRDCVPMYANINRGTVDRSPDGFAASARRAAADGFRHVKLAPFDGVGEGDSADDEGAFQAGLDRISGVCDAVGGDGVAVLVDCHWRLNMARSEALLAFAAERGLYWVECPIPESPEQLPHLLRLRAMASESGVRLAGMEKGIQPADFQPYIDSDVYDALMPDVKYCGGLGAMRTIADAAAAAGDMRISPHNPTGPICHAASVVVSATLPNLSMLEVQYGESPLFQDLVGGALPFVDGAAPVSRAPGLGVELVPDVVAAIEVK